MNEMTYIQALYGSQHYEISQNGKDGSKGRLNGNLLLTAFIILVLMLVLSLLLITIPNLFKNIVPFFKTWFVPNSGKTIGQLITIPLFYVIYQIVLRTVGSKSSFEKNVQAFQTFSEEEKQKANGKILKLFFAALLSLIVVLIFS